VEDNLGLIQHEDTPARGPLKCLGNPQDFLTSITTTCGGCLHGVKRSQSDGGAARQHWPTAAI
jgi:hypothetical protein